ncbi:hypothetical protein [Streptomyces sp. NPDC088258]|uniref:hypothetical protein n=1 Tax=Streptomyces sp. NPDC088258 TaxID=3365849 RepID=UPI0038086F2C
MPDKDHWWDIKKALTGGLTDADMPRDRRAWDAYPLPTAFARLLGLWYDRRDPRLGATLAAAREAGWSLTPLGRAVGVTSDRVRQMASKAADPDEVGPLPDIPARPTPRTMTRQEKERLRGLADEVLEDPADADRRLRLYAQLTELTGQQTKGLTRVLPLYDREMARIVSVTHWRAHPELTEDVLLQAAEAAIPVPPHPEPEPAEPEWYTERLQEYADGDIAPFEDSLLLFGWTPVSSMPARLTDPAHLECIRCDARRDLVIADLMLSDQPTPECDHAGREVHEMPAEHKKARRDIYKRFRDATYTQEAAEAGWKPAETRPARETTPWRLVCVKSDCRRVILARVSHGEHLAPCPGPLTDVEAETERKFGDAGWDVDQHPIQGDSNTLHAIKCRTCGYETRRKAAKKIKPCTHPGSTQETQ